MFEILEGGGTWASEADLGEGKESVVGPGRPAWEVVDAVSEWQPLGPAWKDGKAAMAVLDCRFSDGQIVSRA